MNKPDKIIHCLKCKKITIHMVLDDYKVKCLKCENIKDLRNPHAEAEIATRGKLKDA